MTVAFDSNVLIYLAGLRRQDGDGLKIETAQWLWPALLERVPLVVSHQAFGEVFAVLCRHGWSRVAAKAEIDRQSEAVISVAAKDDAYASAFDLAVGHQFQYWDALIVNVSAGANATVLLSEDMQDGFRWRGLRIVNPFANSLEEILALSSR